MMQGNVALHGFHAPAPAGSALRSAQTVLIVEAQEALRLIAPAPHRQAVVLTQKRMLTQQMLGRVRPDAIVGPLITATWDIVDLAIVLDDLGYAGDLYALTRPLPRAELVVREVGAVCPRLTVHLLEIP